MAEFDFPSTNLTDGDTHTQFGITFVWDATNGAWKKNSAPLTKGEEGDKGEQGDKGIQGDKGLPGEEALKGDQGDKGIQGDEGDKGIQGDKGLPGEEALKGVQGDKGIQGDKGEEGDKGLSGSDAEKGEKGQPSGGFFEILPTHVVNPSNNTTEVEFTGIPAEAYEITLMFAGVSASGTDNFKIQLGTASAYITTNYESLAQNEGGGDELEATDCFIIRSEADARQKTGSMVIRRASNAHYVQTGQFAVNPTEGGNQTYGSVTTGSATVTRLRIILSGTNTFDAGSISLSYKTDGGGDKGEQGDKGVQGDKGEQGDKGIAGQDADKGAQGDKGIQGDKGLPGEDALKGEQGDKGISGAEADKGEQGDKGIQGDKGLPGEDALKGEQGDKGISGAEADKGEQGDKGVQGDKGAAGEDALKGEQGDKGVQGDKGLPGDNADKGVQGDKGLPGEDALKGQQGDKGIQGDKGLPGDNADKGVQGDKGLPGEDALKGESGDKGIQGDKGLPGDNADKGAQGDKGLPGEDALKGQQGDKGTQGDKGVSGSDAEKGEPGGAGSSVPSGGIILWHGAVNLIGSTSAGGTGAGWVLCDGQNGTPDLRNRFVVGAGDYNSNVYPNLKPNATPGGSANATLVSHDHSISLTTGDDTHTHSYNSANHPTSSGPEQNQSGGPEDRTLFNQGKTTGDDTHSHSVSGDTDAEGTSATNANLPPYYALCYIMKT